MSAPRETTECWNCGQSESFEINGYQFGGRLLEGVMFTVTFKDGQVVVTCPGWGTDAYIKHLNIESWCSDIQERMNKRPNYHDDCLYCPHCKEWMA